MPTLPIRCLLALALMPPPAAAHAQREGKVAEIGAGASFVLPDGFVPQSGPAESGTMSWANADRTMTIDVRMRAYADGDATSSAREFDDWPGVGLAFAVGFGTTLARAVEDAVGAPCEREAVPLDHDPQRMAMLVRVDVTCGPTSEPFRYRAYAIGVLTRTRHVIIRIDNAASAFEDGEAVVDTIWNTSAVAEDHRVR
jgi:hypothetical protein